MDHPYSIPKPRKFPLIVDPLGGTTRLTKALMDDGNGLNLMFLDILKGLGLTWDQLQSSTHPFYRVVLDKKFVPLRRVTLPVTFGETSNYRNETLAFEVVNFSRPHHVILGRPCYNKFMALPSYTYLKIKIPRSTGVITVEAKTQRVQGCEQGSIQLVVAAIVVADLRKFSL
jgi:hypothetical protein